ncbi:MAG: hypothetical protein ACLQVY_09710 [Limisphaerales bacterium]
MLDRFERPLRMLALALAAVLIFQLARLLWRGDPLAHLRIPDLPALAASTNAPGTNSVPGTNVAAAKTNVAAVATNAASTNALSTTNAAHATHPTNSETSTDLAATTAKPATNVVSGTNAAIATNPTNSATSTNLAATTNKVATNIVSGTNIATGTNKGSLAAGTNSATGPTNALAQSEHGPRSARSKGMGGMMPGGPPHIDLPPAVQSRVDKIIESEILGPVMHPQPMALLGIADEDVFLRLTNGQTGPVKVGHEFGGIKLLRIGMNRVLIEQDGEKKELTLFGGLGSESLLPKTNEASTNSPAQTNTALAPKPKETL